MRRDRWTDMTKLIVAFRCFAKAVIKNKNPDICLYQAENSSLTDLHCGFVLTVFCEINISCFDCASKLYSFPETLKSPKRKKFTLQKNVKFTLVGTLNIYAYIHVTGDLHVCARKNDKISWPIQL